MPKGNPMGVITARLPQSQAVQVRQLAAARDARLSDVLREAIAEALAKRATEAATPAPVD